MPVMGVAAKLEREEGCHLNNAKALPRCFSQWLALHQIIAKGASRFIFWLEKACAFLGSHSSRYIIKSLPLLKVGTDLVGKATLPCRPLSFLVSAYPVFTTLYYKSSLRINNHLLLFCGSTHPTKHNKMIEGFINCNFLHELIRL